MDVVRHLMKSDIVRMDPKLARDRWNAFRESWGYKGGAPLLTPPDGNTKTAKAGKLGVAVTMGLSLAQAELSGANVCRYKTIACESACVGLNGNRRYDKILAAAIMKTKFLIADPSAFVSLLAAEIDRAHAKYGSSLQVRLNTFSDIPWEEIIPWLFEERPDVKYFDYSKWPDRHPPSNYHLTFSASERTPDSEVVRRVNEGQNVAVVFSTTRTKALPESFKGLQVINGDLHDARWLDPRGVVVGLRAKGSMNKRGGKMVRPG